MKNESEELKKSIISRISEIEDQVFLESISKIIDSGLNSLVIHLTDNQNAIIALSKKDIVEGLFIENSILEKEVKQWLKRR